MFYVFLSELDEPSGSGFGTFAPATQEDEKQDGREEDFEEDDFEEDDGEFISLHELRKNRISREGETTTRFVLLTLPYRQTISTNTSCNLTFIFYDDS